MTELYDICVKCNKKCYPEDIEAWLDFETAPLICECGEVYWVRFVKEPVKIPASFLGQDIPELSLGLAVTIENREHPLHGKNGKIIAKKPEFYRVLIDNKQIWVPTHWIK